MKGPKKHSTDLDRLRSEREEDPRLLERKGPDRTPADVGPGLTVSRERGGDTEWTREGLYLFGRTSVGQHTHDKREPWYTIPDTGRVSKTLTGVDSGLQVSL